MFVRLFFTLGVLMLLFSVGAAFFSFDTNNVSLTSAKKVSDISRSESPVVSIESQPRASDQQNHLLKAAPEIQPKTVSLQSFSTSAKIDQGGPTEFETPPILISNDNSIKEQAPAEVATAPQTVSEVVTLMEMVERCYNSIWEFTPVNAVGLKNTGDSFRWDNPKPFTGLGLTTPNSLVEISYLNMKGDTPSGDRRTCSVRSKNIKRLGLDSFYPEFSLWWKAQFDLSQFESLPISQYAYHNDNDIVHKWFSRGANARGCAINVTYVERHENDIVELTVNVSENEEYCASVGTNLVRVNRLPQVSSN